MCDKGQVRIVRLIILLTYLTIVVLTNSFFRPPEQGKINLMHDDITQRFISFYNAATQHSISESERWLLWKKLYNFSATPPTPEGDSIARQLMNSAWPQYGAVVPVIKKGISNSIYNEAEKTTQAIGRLFENDTAITIYFRTYVGGFEPNAFTTAFNDRITTCVPVEIPAGIRNKLMVHELAHAIHIGMGSVSGNWKRTIATTVLMEGLAMRTSQQLIPGNNDQFYTEYTPGWLEASSRKRIQILTDVKAVLSSDSLTDIMKYTMGKGPAGLEREAYYAGWVVVEYWLKHGMSLGQIARIKEGEMPKIVGKAIEDIIK